MNDPTCVSSRCVNLEWKWCENITPFGQKAATKICPNSKKGEEYTLLCLSFTSLDWCCWQFHSKKQKILLYFAFVPNRTFWWHIRNPGLILTGPTTLPVSIQISVCTWNTWVPPELVEPPVTTTFWPLVVMTAHKHGKLLLLAFLKSWKKS